MDMLLSSGKGCVQHHTSTSGHNFSGLCTWGHTGIVPSDLDLWKRKINASVIGRFCLLSFSAPFSLIASWFGPEAQSKPKEMYLKLYKYALTFLL